MPILTGATPPRSRRRGWVRTWRGTSNIFLPCELARRQVLPSQAAWQAGSPLIHFFISTMLTGQYPLRATGVACGLCRLEPADGLFPALASRHVGRPGNPLDVLVPVCLARLSTADGNLQCPTAECPTPECPTPAVAVRHRRFSCSPPFALIVSGRSRR